MLMQLMKQMLVYVASNYELTYGFYVILIFNYMIRLVLFQYHIGRGHIGATMTAKLYHLLEHRAKEW